MRMDEERNRCDGVVIERFAIRGIDPDNRTMQQAELEAFINKGKVARTY